MEAHQVGEQMDIMEEVRMRKYSVGQQMETAAKCHALR
jgi:hypothetical protein